MRFLVVFLLFVTHPSYANPCTDALRGAPSASERMNGFELRLLNNTEVAPDKNLILTTPALNSALALVANAATGAARAEILNVLGFAEGELSALVRSSKETNNALNVDSTDIKISLASRLFSDTKFPITTSFLSSLDALGGTHSITPFSSNADQSADAINDWASIATHGLIPSIITPDAAGNLVSLIASALYFKGTWKYQYDEKNTRPRPFLTGAGQSKMVPTMTQVIPAMRALTGAGRPYLIARLPYIGDSNAMYVVFPQIDSSSGRPKLSADQALKMALSNGDLDRFEKTEDPDIRQFENQTISMPRFKIKYSNPELKSVLEQLGVHGIFSPGHLTEMSPDPGLYVSYVRLDSLLEVNEQGSEAAGVASVGFALESIVVNPFEFDRPFGIVIRDEINAINIVTGVIQDPTLVESQGGSAQAPSHIQSSQGAIVRKAINGLFFGGLPENRRFASKNGDCSVTVINDDASGVTEIVMQKDAIERKFLVSESDPTLIDRSSPMAGDSSEVFVTNGPQNTSSLKLNMVVGAKGEKFIVVKLGVGVGKAWVCELL